MFACFCPGYQDQRLALVFAAGQGKLHQVNTAPANAPFGDQIRSCGDGQCLAQVWRVELGHKIGRCVDGRGLSLE